MADILRGRLGVVWLALVAATCVSWWLGTDHGTDSATLATAGVMVAAFVKVRLVGIHFMELRDAPVWLRLFIELYVAVIAITLFVLYLAL
jgi:hypothetical protein